MGYNDRIRTGRQNRKHRFLMLGTPKAGKSTFCSGFPKGIFLPIKGEEGIDDLNITSYPVVNSYEELMEDLEEILTDEHDRETLIIDSASTLELLIIEYLCKKFGADSFAKVAGGYGNHYVELCGAWQSVLHKLDEIRDTRKMNIVLIGHCVIKTVQDPLIENYDSYIFDINNKSAGVVEKWVDSILFATQRVHVKEFEAGFNRKKGKAIASDERVLITRGYPGCPSDGRGIYGHLPPMMKLDFEIFKNEIILATKNRNEAEAQTKE